MSRALLLLLFAMPLAVDAEELVQQVGPARLSTNAVRDDQQWATKFSDLLLFTVRVESESGLEVEAPSVWTQSPGWRVRVQQAGATKTLGERATWEETFRLDPLVPGTHPVHLDAVRYRIGKGTWHTVRWQPFSVKVTAQLRDVDRTSLRDPVSIEEVPSLPERSSPWWLALPPLLGVVLAAAWWLLRRERTLPARSAEEIARHELDRLQRLDLPSRGRIEEFHTLLANIVRRFLERKYDLPARHQTTPEFLAGLDQGPLSPSQRSFLAEFLRACDQAKFARAQISPEQCAALLEQTRSFL